MRFLHGKAVPWAAFLLAALAVAVASLWLIVPIWLPQKAPAPYVFSAQSAPAAAPLLDINTADAAALTTLPGVGQAKAEAIVRYRDEHGFFAALQDVAAVSGISQRMVESWAGLACVQPPVKEQEEHSLG